MREQEHATGSGSKAGTQRPGSATRTQASNASGRVSKHGQASKAEQRDSDKSKAKNKARQRGWWVESLCMYIRSNQLNDRLYVLVSGCEESIWVCLYVFLGGQVPTTIQKSQAAFMETQRSCRAWSHPLVHAW